MAAIYGNGICQELAPAWREIWRREDRERELAKVGRIDWEALLAAADDAICTEYRYRGTREYRGMYMGETLSGVKRRAYDAAMTYEKCEMALYVACQSAGVPEIAVIKAARIMGRYYERGGSQVIDAKRLIMSQI